MNSQSLRERLELVKNKYLLCRFDSAFFTGIFTQVCLEIISDEADLVLREYPYFDLNSQDNFCYVKFDSFKEFIIEKDNNYDYLDDFTTSREEEEFIADYLENRLVIIKPYFYYNSSRDVFFKNGTVVDIIDTERRKTNTYFTIPQIPSADSFKKLLEGNPFALNSVSESLMGSQDYLAYNNEIYKVELETIESNDCYWKLKEGVSSIKKLDIDYDSLYASNDLIGEPNSHPMDFMYAAKNQIVGMPLKDVKKDADEASKPADINEGFESLGPDKLINDFFNYIKTQNLCYTKNDISNFYTCITSGQLVILAGMSGTGKTRLPLKFGEYFNMTEENNRLLFLPVSPSFIEPSDVLGFLNPNTNTYVSSDTRLVEFLIEAEKNQDKMHMVILDEMNLAQIEFWFAPFISILEKEPSERILHLYSEKQECKNNKSYPSKLRIGRNVIFIGTINLDETTKDISDRLIDRSYIINLKKESFMNYQAQQASKNITAVSFNGELMDSIPVVDQSFNYITRFTTRELELFDKLHNLLNSIDREKGISFRSVRNIAVYLNNKPKEFDQGLAFDYAFKQTVMKKINGSQDSIGELLGVIDEDGMPLGALSRIFDEYEDISDFSECRVEIKNKILELKKYGYAR